MPPKGKHSKGKKSTTTNVSSSSQTSTSKFDKILNEFLPESVRNDEVVRNYVDALLSNNEIDFENFQESLTPFLVEAGISSSEISELSQKLWNSSGRSSQTNNSNENLKKLETPGISLASKIDQQQIEAQFLKNEKNVETVVQKETQSKKKSKKDKQQQQQQQQQQTQQESQQASFFSDRDVSNVEGEVRSTNVRFKHDEILRTTSKDIALRGVTVSFGNIDLLESADLRLTFGHHYGLIGRNGIGKTTLLRYIAAGKIYQFPTSVRTLLVEQEAVITGDTNVSAINCVLSSDTRRQRLMKRLEFLEQRGNYEEDGEEIAQIYSQLDTMDSFSMEAKARKILVGLGFTDEMIEANVDTLSGGWRMRISLACALLTQPDLLMLDEPTNHLDLPAILWLQRFLQKYENTVIVISHDRAFLNNVCSDIIYFNKKKLKYCPGNFDTFLQRKEEKLRQQERQQELDEKKTEKLKESIENIKQASKDKNKNVGGMIGSKKKQLQKIGGPKIIAGTRATLWDEFWAWGGEALIEIEEEGFGVPVSFHFRNPASIGTKASVLQLKDVSFRYPGAKEDIFHDVQMDFDLESRVFVLAPNGYGKTTLMQCIAGEAEPTKGEIYKNNKLKIGYFGQHHINELPGNLSSLQHFSNLFPECSEKDARAQLGSFGIGGKLVLQKISTLSGGQKVRVLLSIIAYKEPNFLILDEPTNHLDFFSIEALIDALKKFEGGIFACSHDQHFISSLAKQYYIIHNKKVTKFDATFEDYVKKYVPIVD